MSSTKNFIYLAAIIAIRYEISPVRLEFFLLVHPNLRICLLLKWRFGRKNLSRFFCAMGIFYFEKKAASISVWLSMHFTLTKKP